MVRVMFLLAGDVRVSIRREDRLYASVYPTTACKHRYLSPGIACGRDLRFLARGDRAVEFRISHVILYERSNAAPAPAAPATENGPQ